MSAESVTSNQSIRFVVKAMGLTLVLVLGVGVPAGFGLMNHFANLAQLQHKAEMSAGAIEGFIYKTPEMWKFQAHRLGGLLGPHNPENHLLDRALIVGDEVLAAPDIGERTIMVDQAGLADSHLPWPRVVVYEPVLLHDEQVATVRIITSVRPQLIKLGLVWLGFAVLAAIGYRSLAVAPLQLLDRTIADLRETAERARAADIAKSEFLATMSHEIRTPLNGVIGTAELLETTRLSERQSMFTEIIRTSARSLLSVINDILDFSKIDAGYLQIDARPFKLSLIVNEPARLVAHVAESKGLELTLRVQPDLPVGVIGDLGRIRQVVTNLLSNAVKFTESGQVVVDVSGVEQGSRDGGRQIALRVEVRDTGIGIAPDQIERIFGKFSQVDSSMTRRHEGTGLGLSIAKGLVELMGGQFGAESTPGVGSTFWFTLTLNIDESAERKPLAPFAAEGKRVLVIDDNETSRGILQELLGAWRFSHAAAASGKDGMHRLLEASSQGRPFDLVILDSHMPDMNGEDVVHAMRDVPEVADTPTILLTFIEDSCITQNGCSLGVPGCITKPVLASQLFDTIVAVLAGNAAVRSAEPGEAEATSALVLQSGSGTVDVLLVEDNYVNRFVAEQILLQMGLTHVVAENGEVAIARFEETAPGLILMDVSMPTMNGHEATRQIRDIEQARGLHRTPIIGLTANAMQGDREKCLAAGMDDYISKPVSIAKLTTLVAKWRAAAASPGEGDGGQVDISPETVAAQ